MASGLVDAKRLQVVAAHDGGRAMRTGEELQALFPAVDEGEQAALFEAVVNRDAGVVEGGPEPVEPRSGGQVANRACQHTDSPVAEVEQVARSAEGAAPVVG